MAALEVKPYLRSSRPGDDTSKTTDTTVKQYPSNQYLDDELRKIQLSIASLAAAIKQLQTAVGSPPL